MEECIIRKQYYIMAFLLVLFVAIGTISAEDVNNNTVTTDNSIDAISTSDNINNNVPSTTNSMHTTAQAYDASINVKVNYEYASDEDSVQPDFRIFSDDKEITFEKTYNKDSKEYTLKLNQVSDDDTYNITALTSGYNSENLIITTTDETVNFKLTATDAYKLGRTVTASADEKLNFKTADDVLVVTSAGVSRLNNKNTEDAIEAILNYDDNIDYTDVLMLRESAIDPIDFAFIIKRGNDLQVIVYENASTKYSYLGTISENMTRSQWNNYFKSIKGKNAWSFASLANGWAAGVSREVLQEAAFHGHICEGTLGGYSIVQALLKYYPPVKETSTGGGSPGDITSYKILGVPGGSDDDAAMFFLDATVGKIGYVGIDTTATGATENMIGFIRWYANTNTGDLIIMTFDSNQTKSQFTRETGINPDSGSLEELKYCSWWINKINTNPEDLVTFLYEFTDLNADQYYYLMGTASDVQTDEDHSVQAIDSHGLDLDYILSQNLPKATRTLETQKTGSLTDKEMKQIGIDAANKAREIYKEELGIDIAKDDVDFAVFTSAGYVYLDNQETVLVRDGLYETLGASLYSKNMLQYHQALWKPLWFAFIMRNPNSDVVYAAYLRYNSDGTFFVGDLEGEKVVNIGIETLNDSEKLGAIQKTFMPDGNWFSIQTIANAWKSDPEFDQIMSFLYHNHVCPGVQPGFFITDYVHNNYPLNENESYTYIASSTYCKDDSLTYILGVSPGMGTFIVQKLPNSEVESEYVDGATDEGALVIWDNELNIGRVVIISFKWPTVDTSMYSTSEAKRATQIQAFIDMYKGNPNDKVVEDLVVEANEERWINAEQFNTLKAGSGDLNTMSYIKSLPKLTKEDLLKDASEGEDSHNYGQEYQNDTSNNSGTNSGSSPNSATNTNTGTNTNSRPSSSSSSSSKTSNTQSKTSNTASVAVGTAQPTVQAVGTVSEEAQSEESEDTSSESPSDSDSGKAYELTEESTSNNNANVGYAIVAIGLVGALAGYGYYRSRKNE